MHAPSTAGPDRPASASSNCWWPWRIVLIIMGGALTALTNAYRSNESAKIVTDVNNNLRIGVDLIVRDFIQVGQGLPTGRTVQVPSGTGALQIQRPHPQGSTCTAWPAGTATIPAVTPGPGCGPTIDGVATDMVTTLAVDSVLDARSRSELQRRRAHGHRVDAGAGRRRAGTSAPAAPTTSGWAT